MKKMSIEGMLNPVEKPKSPEEIQAERRDALRKKMAESFEEKRNKKTKKKSININPPEEETNTPEKQLSDIIDNLKSFGNQLTVMKSNVIEHPNNIDMVDLTGDSVDTRRNSWEEQVRQKPPKRPCIETNQEQANKANDALKYYSNIVSPGSI